MIVALDAQLAVGHGTGIGEYVTGLAHALRSEGIGVVELCEPKLDPWRFDRRLAWDQVLLPRRARSSGASVLHCASGTMPLRNSLPTVVTVHDVAWLKVQRHTRPYARYYFGRFSMHRYRTAAAILTDSHFSRRELLEVSNVQPERVHVAYPGVASDYCTLRRSEQPAMTVLVPGTVERRKNLEVLIRALRLLPAVRLLSVGPWTPYKGTCERLAAELGVEDRVQYCGYVSRERLLELYATCAVVAVPSRYEGFGYAAAQALCAGAPVLVSDAQALTEITAGSAPVIAAGDHVQWARCIERIAGDPAGANAHAAVQRDTAIARFAWAASARTVREVYETALRSAR